MYLDSENITKIRYSGSNDIDHALESKREESPAPVGFRKDNERQQQ